MPNSMRSWFLGVCLTLSLMLLQEAKGTVTDQNQIFIVENSFDQTIVYDQIEDILIDRDGFVWIATSTGLYMNNGYEYKTFIHQVDKENSISESFVTSLFEDGAGRIWIGTYNNGLNIYSKRTQSFTVYRRDPNTDKSIASNKIPRWPNVLEHATTGEVWVATPGNLNKVNPNEQLVARHPVDFSGQILMNPLDSVLWLVGDVIGTYSSNKGVKVWLDVPEQHGEIHDAIFDSKDRLWLATESGLMLFDKEHGLVSASKKLGLENALPSQEVQGLYIDRIGRLWCGIDKSIYILNLEGTSMERLNSENGLLDEKIRGIYGDQNGNIYVTYQSRGLTSLRLSTNRFENITAREIGLDAGGLNNVRAIHKDKSGALWMGTYNHGLIKYQEGSSIESFIHDPSNPKSLPANFITAIFMDSHDRLWVGTFENGFVYSDLPDLSVSLEFTPSEFNDIEIHEFKEDSYGNVWIATNEGFVVYNSRDNNFRKYGESDSEVIEILEINVQSMLFDERDNMWFASWNRGVGKLRLESEGSGKDSLILFENPKDRQGKALDNRFIDISKDNNGNIWLASSANGLVKMTLGDEVGFKKFDLLAGAPSNTIYSVVQTKDNEMWVSSANGLARFDPSLERFTSFFESDGLISDSFIWDSYFQDSEGKLYFGNINGATLFYPDSILLEKRDSEAYFSKLFIHHGEVFPGGNLNGRVLLEKSIRFQDEITLTHDEQNFSIEFAALNVLDASEVKFQYQLVGFDENWIPATWTNRLATYTNLSPDTYVLRVKASQDVVEENQPIAELRIVVLPPWWKTLWAYAIYTILIAVILFMVQRELSKRVSLRHKLELEQYKHDRDNELNKEKFQFFTNLSHELRTPLTLILGPLARMIDKKEVNTRVRQNLLLMQKQAQRLQKLTNQLMDFRKYEIENLKLKAAKGNIVAFVEEIFVAFRQHAKMKQVHFDLNKKVDEILMYYDRDKLEIILVNLLSNAFKFTSQNGTVSIEIDRIDAKHVNDLQAPNSETGSSYGDLDPQQKKVTRIKVSDTGVGISPDQLTHIFDRYFQASNLQSISIGGTGIGLEIAKNYVELHRGVIMVESVLGKGTTFTIWLPIGEEHLNKDEIIQDFKASEHVDHYSLENDRLEMEIDSVSTEDLQPELSTLLIVDDNPDIIYFLKQNFESSFNVLSAQNGKQALELTNEHLPDLIISDIMMPEIDGLEFCNTVKSNVRTSHIPVILLTARTANVFQAEGLESGADDYITKPFDEKILNIKVKNLIDSRQQLRRRYSQEASMLPEDLTLTRPDEEFLTNVIKLIDQNLSSNELSVEWLAKEVGMSHSVLYKKISALTDLNVVEFIRSIRLKKAAVLLKETTLKINEISTQVGFSDSKYFSKSFQSFFGRTPSDYKES